MAAYRPITDLWMLSRPKAQYYGAYPAGFLERARYLLGVQLYDPVLHVCGGAVRDYQSGPMKGKGLGPNDKTLDLDPNLEPDFLLDATLMGVSPGDVFPYWTPNGGDKSEGISVGQFECSADGEGPFNIASGRRPWPACLIDRPYTDADAENYAPGADGYPTDLNALLRRALSVTRIGGRVGVLDYLWPKPPRDISTILVAVIGVICGWNNRMRVFSVYERACNNPLEYNVMTQDEPEDEESRQLPIFDDEPSPQLTPEATSEPTEAPEEVLAVEAPTPTRKRKARRKVKLRRRTVDLTDGYGA